MRCHIYIQTYDRDTSTVPSLTRCERSALAWPHGARRAQLYESSRSDTLYGPRDRSAFVAVPQISRARSEIARGSRCVGIGPYHACDGTGMKEQQRRVIRMARTGTDHVGSSVDVPCVVYAARAAVVARSEVAVGSADE